MNFNIVEKKESSYEDMKEAYLNGIRGKQLREMFDIGSSAYTRLLKEFREDGIIVPHRGNNKINKPIKNYYYRVINGIGYWVVSKKINYKTYYFGHYHSKAEAEERVKELKQNNWEGLLNG